MSLDSRASELESALAGSGRHADLALALRRAKTGETLLYAGGRWDRVAKKFSGEPERVAVVDMEESQVAYTKWFAEFLRDYREDKQRDVRLALVAGDRRGGKTFDAFLCELAAMVDVPSAIGWTISKSFRHREELEQIVLSYLPEAMYRQTKAPEYRFTFPNGSVMRNLSQDDPDSMKQGRCDFLLYNEAQLMSPRAIRNGLFGTTDRGGLCVLAANPPSGPEGDWLRDLKDGIDDDPELRAITRFFNFSSKDNTKVDQAARRGVAAIARRIDPEMLEADDEGAWRRWGDLAYPAWDGRPLERGGLVGDPPEGAVDVTYQVTRSVLGEPHAHVIGGDFQRRPQAAAILKVFDLPEGRVFWFVGECGVRGTEVELSTELLGAPHALTPAPNDPRGACWVADCSGSWQGAERIRGRTSFALLEGEGWTVYPAEIIRVPGRSDHPKNPEVGQRLGLMFRLMQARRVRVSPSCEWLREAFAKCQLRPTSTGKRSPSGRFAHVTDAASYPVWRLEPKPLAERAPLAQSVVIQRRPDRRGFL